MNVLKPIQKLCKICWKHISECDLDNPCGCLLPANDVIITRDHLITMSKQDAAKFKPVPLSFIEAMLGKSPMKMGGQEPEYYLSEALLKLFTRKCVVVEQSQYERQILQLSFKRSFRSLVFMRICKALRVLLRRKAPQRVETHREEFNLLIHSVPRGYFTRD